MSMISNILQQTEDNNAIHGI